MDTDTSTSKVNSKMFSALTHGEYRNMHQAQVISEYLIDDSVHPFSDVLGERCSQKYKTLDNDFTKTNGRKIGHQGGDLETYSWKYVCFTSSRDVIGWSKG